MADFIFDFFDYKSKSYLLIVDTFSHWLEVFPTNDKTAKTVIKHCKDIFSKFGVPDIFYSDNVPYNSVEFKNFAKSWNFESQYSSPHYHQSNGFAEKYVDISKNMLKKMRNPDELSYYLLEYRNTPLPSIGYAPSQLLLNRLVKTKLPITSENLLPKIIDQKDVTLKLNQNSENVQKYYNKTAKDLPPLQKNDNVLFKKNNLWNKGKVIDKYNDRSYLIKDTYGNEFRRNRRLVNKTNLPVQINDNSFNDLLYEITDFDCSKTSSLSLNASIIENVENIPAEILSEIDSTEYLSISNQENTVINSPVDTKSLINSDNGSDSDNDHNQVCNNIEYVFLSDSSSSTNEHFSDHDSENDFPKCDETEAQSLITKRSRKIKKPKYLDDYDLS